MIGHCLGAAGGLEAIATLKAITTGWVHPSINQFVSGIVFSWLSLSELYLDFKYNRVIRTYILIIFLQWFLSIYGIFSTLVGFSKSILEKKPRYHHVYLKIIILHPEITISQLVVHIHMDPHILYN